MYKYTYFVCTEIVVAALSDLDLSKYPPPVWSAESIERKDVSRRLRVKTPKLYHLLSIISVVVLQLADPFKDAGHDAVHVTIDKLAVDNLQQAASYWPLVTNDLVVSMTTGY